MLLTDARRGARIAPDGNLIPLGEQDRSRWDRDQIAEGVALISEAARRTASLPERRYLTGRAARLAGATRSLLAM